MEQTIATLIKDFEHGRMDRRQLIKSLAALAMVSGAAPAQAQTKAPWKTVHLDHISYAVSDYKKSAEWYSNLMGWQVMNDGLSVMLGVPQLSETVTRSLAFNVMLSCPLKVIVWL